MLHQQTVEATVSLQMVGDHHEVITVMERGIVTPINNTNKGRLITSLDRYL